MADSQKPAFGKQKKDNTMLYGFILLLAAGFFVLVGLTFMFAGSFSPGFGKCVAIVEIDGEIATKGLPMSLLSEGVPGSEDYAVTIEELNSREDVASVLFVINSPGGSVVAAHDIYYAIKSVEKPKVAYFREVAASAGYYIATPTDYIMSDPDTLTGSIGAVMTVAEMKGLFDKLGVNITNVVSGQYKDIGAPNKELTSDELAMLQVIVNESYQGFKSVILNERKGKLNVPLFEEIADGRVLSASQAKSVGLIDALGTKKDAINKAAELGGITEEPRVCKIKVVPQGYDGSLLGADSFMQKIMNYGGGKKISLTFE
jgi:protease-4